MCSDRHSRTRSLVSRVSLHNRYRLSKKSFSVFIVYSLLYVQQVLNHFCSKNYYINGSRIIPFFLFSSILLNVFVVTFFPCLKYFPFFLSHFSMYKKFRSILFNKLLINILINRVKTSLTDSKQIQNKNINRSVMCSVTKNYDVIKSGPILCSKLL